MDFIQEKAFQRKRWLDQLISYKKKCLKKAPKGRLNIDASKKHPQYYQVDETGDAHYISVKETELIRDLAQKDYDQRIIFLAEQERKVMEKVIAHRKDVKPEELFYLLRKERQALVTPVIPTKEEMIRAFRAQIFEPNPLPVGDTGLETDRGEIVRTRAEYIIANDINRTEAEYHYEKPLFLEGWGTVYPDFTILNVRTGRIYYWEHLGRTNDLKYIHKNIRKIEAYAKNGYYPGEKLILSSETVDFETGEIRIDVQLIKQLVGKYCT